MWPPAIMPRANVRCCDGWLLGVQGAGLTAPLFLRLHRSELSNQICKRTNGRGGEAVNRLPQGRAEQSCLRIVTQTFPRIRGTALAYRDPKEGDKGLAAKSRHPRGRGIRMREVVRTEEQVARSVLEVQCTMAAVRATRSWHHRQCEGLGMD